MKRASLLSLLFIGSSLFFFSCSEEVEQTKTEENVTPEIVSDDGHADEGFDFFLPSSVQIAHILKKSGVKYQDGLTNDPERYVEYETRAKRLLNLGVYTGDLAYCILNKENDAGLKYVRALKNLANNLDLAEVYHSSAALDKVEQTMNNQDSLLAFIIDTQEKLNDYAHTNHQLSLLLETFTGAWIESMYIGANAENSHPEFIHKRLAEQMGILDNLISGLEMSTSNNPEMMSVVAELKEFQSMMPAYEGDFEQGISQEDFEKMKVKITEIRNNITNS